MTELHDIPHDIYNQGNILVDEVINGNQEIITHKIVNPQDINLNDLNFQIKEAVYEPDNYLSQMFHKNFSVNLLILLSVIVLIMLEFIYRRSLFKYSLTYEQNLQSSLSKDEIEFYKFVSILGGGVFIGFGLFFVFCCFPLVKTVILCVCLIFTVYFHDILKLVHGDPRPFWINTVLFKGECETSYGNPSGHSLIGFFFYLSLAYLICTLDSFKFNLAFKIIAYLVAIFISSLTAFSRLALGLHSLDQVLYGSVLGIWLFVVFAYVFKVYDMPLSYYLKFFKDKQYFYFFLLTLLILFIIPIVLYYLIDTEEDYTKYDLVMKKKCKGTEDYKLYSNNCMAESLIILLIVGIFLGQYMFWHLIYKNSNAHTNNLDYLLTLEESVNHWNVYYKQVYASLGNIIKTLGLVVLCLLPGIFYFIIPGEKYSLRNIFIFKIGLPLILIGFLTFGPCLYALINILKEKQTDVTNYV